MGSTLMGISISLTVVAPTASLCLVIHPGECLSERTEYDDLADAVSMCSCWLKMSKWWRLKADESKKSAKPSGPFDLISKNPT